MLSGRIELTLWPNLNYALIGGCCVVRSLEHYRSGKNSQDHLLMPFNIPMSCSLMIGLQLVIPADDATDNNNNHMARL